MGHRIVAAAVIVAGCTQSSTYDAGSDAGGDAGVDIDARVCDLATDLGGDAGSDGGRDLGADDLGPELGACAITLGSGDAFVGFGCATDRDCFDPAFTCQLGICCSGIVSPIDCQCRCGTGPGCLHLCGMPGP